MGNKRSTPIPGLSFSWKRALGITRAKQNLRANRHSYHKRRLGAKNWWIYTQKVNRKVTDYIL